MCIGIDLTPSVQSLLDEVTSLKPSAPLHFMEMTDTNLLQRSGGAATRENTNGEEAIHLDYTRVTQYMIAHELSHIKLHRLGWPRLRGTVDSYSICKTVADHIDNIADHIRFVPVLNSLDVFDEAYCMSLIEGIKESEPQNFDPFDAINLALVAIDAIAHNPTSRDEILSMVALRHKPVIKPLRDLLRIMSPCWSGDAMAVRRCLVDTLYYIEGVAFETYGVPAKLPKTITISPVFITKELMQPASDKLDLVVTHELLNGQKIWLIGVTLRKDTSRIRVYLSRELALPKEDVSQLEHNLKHYSLADFLRGEAIIYMEI